MKYDCSKTLGYSHEMKRLCKSMEGQDCSKCAMHNPDGTSCNDSLEIDEVKIKKLQDWSDNHPELTRQDVFFKLFPQAMRTSKELHEYIDGSSESYNLYTVYYPALCYGYLVNDAMCDKVAPDCFTCWQQPYRGEFNIGDDFNE